MTRGVLNKRKRERLLSTVWGGAWGVVVGGVIIAVASQLAVRHDLALPQPEARAVETPAGTEFAQERPDSDPAVPSEETVPAADLAAVTPAQPEVSETSPMLDTTPAAAPRPAFAGPDAPDRPVVPTGSEVALTSREGLRPETAGAPEARAPLPPPTDQPASVSRDVPAAPVREPAPALTEATPPASAPAALPVTETATLTPPVEEDAPVLGEAAEAAQPALQPVPEAPDAVAETARAPRADATPDAVVASLDAAAPEVPGASEAPEAPDTVAEAAPAAPTPAAPGGEAPAQAPELTRDLAEAPAEPQTPQSSGVELAEVMPAPQPAAPRPAFVTPGAPETEPAVPENPQFADSRALPETALPGRLDVAPEPPGIRIAQAPEAASELPGVPSASIGRRVGTLPGSRTDIEPSPAPAAQPDAMGGEGALAAHRREFTAEGDLARLAVVLVHLGAASPDTSALAALPGEVSFAVDGASANAAEIASAYRAAGREVVLIPALPAGARPQDIEVALQANLAAVDEAVAVMDPGDAGFQGEREAVGQVIRMISETGHGLITAPQGLNTAQQIAGRFGVPAALIFDDLGAGGDAAAISRAIDRAAFRARQEAGVILLGQAEPATIEGLGNWLGGRNAQSLTLAPVSAVIAPDAPATEAADAAEPEAAARQGNLPRVRSVPDSRSN